MSAATLGLNEPTAASCNMIKGRPWVTDRPIARADGQPFASAPRFTFGGGVTATCSLTADGRYAAATLTAAEVDTIFESGNPGFELDDPSTGRVWAYGPVVWRSNNVGAGGAGLQPTDGESVVVSSNTLVIVGGGDFVGRLPESLLPEGYIKGQAGGIAALDALGQVVDADGNVVGDGGGSGDMLAAYAPVLRSPTPRPEWISTFQPGHGWIDSNGEGGVTDDTSDFVIGTQSLRITGGGSARRTGLTVDLTGKALSVMIRVDSLDAGSIVVVYAANANFTSYYAWNIRRHSDPVPWFPNGEWVTLTLPVEDAGVSGTPDRASIQTLQVRTLSGTGQLHLQAIGTVPVQTTYPSGVVSITFDDGYDEMVEAARRVLTPRGLPATLYVIPERIDYSADFLTTAGLNELANVHRWDLQAHGVEFMKDITPTQMRAYWVYLKDWFAARGLGRPDHLAYPGGYNTLESIAPVREFFTSARTIASPTAETWPPAEPHRLRALTGITDWATYPTIATAKAAIDKAVAGKGWLNLVFHRVVDTPESSLDISWEGLADIADYAIASGAAIKTVAEMFA